MAGWHVYRDSYLFLYTRISPFPFSNRSPQVSAGHSLSRSSLYIQACLVPKCGYVTKSELTLYKWKSCVQCPGHLLKSELFSQVFSPCLLPACWEIVPSESSVSRWQSHPAVPGPHALKCCKRKKWTSFQVVVVCLLCVSVLCCCWCCYKTFACTLIIRDCPVNLHLGRLKAPTRGKSKQEGIRRNGSRLWWPYLFNKLCPGAELLSRFSSHVCWWPLYNPQVPTQGQLSLWLFHRFSAFLFP